MSLTNATLLRVDPPAPPGVSGDPLPVVPGPAIAARCLLAEPTATLRRLIAELELDSTASLYVRWCDYPTAAADIVLAGVVLVRLDGEADPRRLTVDHVASRSFGALSHTAALLREAN